MDKIKKLKRKKRNILVNWNVSLIGRKIKEINALREFKEIYAKKVEPINKQIKKLQEKVKQ
jgi:hypothetical protein